MSKALEFPRNQERDSSDTATALPQYLSHVFHGEASAESDEAMIAYKLS